MRRLVVFLFVIMMLSTAGVFAASSETVAVLYHGRNETNRHALEFMNAYSRTHGARIPLQVLSVDGAESFNPDDYRAVIVLNTGRRTGIAPQFTSFLDRWRDEIPIITINLYSGRQSTTVEQNGVDAVTVGSDWGFYLSPVDLQSGCGFRLHCIDRRFSLDACQYHRWRQSPGSSAPSPV